MTKRIFLFFIFAIGLLGTSSPSYAITMRVNAPKVELELMPGEIYSGEIIVENPTQDVVSMKAYLEDWVYKPSGKGEKNFSPAGTTDHSCSSWVTFSPSEAAIEPFGLVKVRYTVNVPDNAQGGNYSVLFFETMLGVQTDEDGVSVQVAGRIGSLFFVRVKGQSSRDGKIDVAQVQQPEGNKPFEIHTTFTNTGNVDVALGGKFLFMSEDGQVLGRGDMAKIYTTQGMTESGITEWVGRLPAGKYDAILTYDLGEGKSLVEETSFTVA